MDLMFTAEGSRLKALEMSKGYFCYIFLELEKNDL